MVLIYEGGNAKTKTGEQASKMKVGELSLELYNSLRKDIIGILVEINNAYYQVYNEYIWAEKSIRDFSVFSGSGFQFLTKGKEEFTKVKPILR